METVKKFKSALLLCAIILISAAFSAEAAKAGLTVKGTVTDASGAKVAKAAVYLIPAADVEKLASTPIEIKKGSTNDEPLEDALAAGKDGYMKAETDKAGAFKISGVAKGRYFVYVAPADGAHLPGGDMSNVAMDMNKPMAKPLKIMVSGSTPAGAVYVGSSRCIACHGQYASVKKTLHKLGIRVVGKDSKLQDSSRFPEIDDGMQKLKAGTKFYFYNFDKTRSFDKFMISTEMPKDPAAVVSFTATFFTDTDGMLKFKTENLKDPSDPARTYTVEMTYGGGLYKQRYLYRTKEGVFPFVQYNAKGDNSFGDRSRKQWRDYHADWLFNEETGKLIDPPAKKEFGKECASCHFTGYTLKDVNGRMVAGAVNDPNGEADIDGDGIANELNIGCEVCHGPGSEHVMAPKGKKAALIVSPGKLSVDRAVTLCVQCHSRPLGFLNNEQPVNKDNMMMLPGTSRNDYLVNYTTREDADKKDFWPDGLHSKSHHQQDTDFLKSKKYRNGRRLMKCADCHDLHGMTELKHQLKADVRDAKNSLCAGCHKDKSNVSKHMQAKLGVADMGKINCIDCHMSKSMQTGAGMGKGLARKDGKNYWMNDITSHIFDVPRKDNVGVKGVEPGKAMPIPYTNACGSCHNVEGL